MIYMTQFSGVLLLLPALCRATHLWINLTRLSELSVSYQKFSIDNGALQVRRWLASVRQAYVAADGRFESIADIVMKVVMFLESLFQNVLLEEQRSCQSATEFHDRQFNLKENRGLQSMWSRRNLEGENLCVEHKPNSPASFNPEDCVTLRQIDQCAGMILNLKELHRW